MITDKILLLRLFESDVMLIDLRVEYVIFSAVSVIFLVDFVIVVAAVVETLVIAAAIFETSDYVAAIDPDLRDVEEVLKTEIFLRKERKPINPNNESIQTREELLYTDLNLKDENPTRFFKEISQI